MITLTSFDRTPSLAELKVSYRRNPRKNRAGEVQTLTSPISSERYLRQVWDKNTFDLREEFLVVCLATSNRVLGWVRVASGGMNSVIVDPRLVFSIALQVASASILVAHNHPGGGTPVPSADDISATRRLKGAGELLGVRLLDHLILTRDGCYSFAEAGEW